MKKLALLTTLVFSVMFSSASFAEVALAENQKFKTADGAINIYTKPVPLNLYDVKLKTVGKLRYRGGIHLYSDNKRFGGLSSLSVSVDRQRLISFSDDGMAFYARLIYDRSGNLVGVKDTYFKPLIGLEGQSLTSKFESDAESMAVGMDGEMIVSFERFHRFWRYRPGSFLPERMPGPEAMLRLPYNKGIEALTYFSKGRLIALSESEFSSNSNSVLGWVGHSKGWIELTYLIGGGYRVTGAATLPNGNIMVLERLFSRGGKNAIRLKSIEAGSIIGGTVLEGKLIAELSSPITIDNFEGIAIREEFKGKAIIYLISDDNFNPEQRTLLMIFEMH